MSKRLEAGTFSWPKADGRTKLRLKAEALAMLTDGIDLRGAKMRPWYERQPLPPCAVAGTAMIAQNKGLSRSDDRLPHFFKLAAPRTNYPVSGYIPSRSKTIKQVCEINSLPDQYIMLIAFDK